MADYAYSEVSSLSTSVSAFRLAATLFNFRLRFQLRPIRRRRSHTSQDQWDCAGFGYTDHGGIIGETY